MPVPWPPEAGALLIAVLLSAAALLLTMKDRRRRPAVGNRARSNQAQPSGPDEPRPGQAELPAPIMLELTASMLEAGLSLDQALTVLSRICGEQTGGGLTTVVSAIRLGAGWEQAWATTTANASAATLDELQDGLGFAAATGAPSSALLSAQAQQLRRRSYRAAEQRAAALGVKLVLPMGLCSLPAFVCVGVLPVLLAMLPSAG